MMRENIRGLMRNAGFQFSVDFVWEPHNDALAAGLARMWRWRQRMAS